MLCGYAQRLNAHSVRVCPFTFTASVFVRAATRLFFSAFKKKKIHSAKRPQHIARKVPYCCSSDRLRVCHWAQLLQHQFLQAAVVFYIPRRPKRKTQRTRCKHPRVWIFVHVVGGGGARARSINVIIDDAFRSASWRVRRDDGTATTAAQHSVTCTV